MSDDFSQDGSVEQFNTGMKEMLTGIIHRAFPFLAMLPPDLRETSLANVRAELDAKINEHWQGSDLAVKEAVKAHLNTLLTTEMVAQYVADHSVLDDLKNWIPDVLPS